VLIVPRIFGVHSMSKLSGVVAFASVLAMSYATSTYGRTAEQFPLTVLPASELESSTLGKAQPELMTRLIALGAKKNAGFSTRGGVEVAQATIQRGDALSSPLPHQTPAITPAALATSTAAVTPPATNVNSFQVAAANDPFSIPLTPSTHYTQLPTPSSFEYNIPHIPQEQAMWCWAAAAQQAIGWVNNGRAPAQCAIVALGHGLSVDECCANPQQVCNITGEIPAIGALVQRFGGDARELVSVPTSPEMIDTLMKDGSTLLIRLRPAPHDAAVGIRHMIVIRGIEYIRLPNGALDATVHYNDPLGDGQRAVSFDEIFGFFEQALLISRK